MLFSKPFIDTTFLKDDNSLDYQLNKLNSFKEILSNNEEIDKDIKLLEYGIQGENNVKFELMNSNIGMYVLHDVSFEINDNKVQIDYMIFTSGYCYILECKNLYGDITVDNNGQFYREYKIKNELVKESIYSPYTQSLRHRDILTKLWASRHSNFINKLFKVGKDDNWFKPLVVLTNSKSILNKENAPDNIKNNIIRSDQLISYIKSDINKINKLDLLSENTVKKIAESWLSIITNNDSSILNKYISLVLETELKEFRKEKSRSMNIPAYYVFTDEELESIINLKPMSIEELIESNILPEIKIKCHGEDIINIIKNIIV